MRPLLPLLRGLLALNVMVGAVFYAVFEAQLKMWLACAAFDGCGGEEPKVKVVRVETP